MKLSIVIPTYNNELTIGECLESIFMQDFPKKDFEVLIIDGGSSDKTLEISKKYPVKIFENKKRNEEAAKILALKKIKGEIVCFIDSDNILIGKDWILMMLDPFKDKEINFADTLYYSYRKNDLNKVKYHALIGGDDPLILYLGLYSRWSYLNNDWTGCPHKGEDKGLYFKSKFLNLNKIPPMGSNGFIIRTKIVKKFVKKSFIHSDIVYELVNNGYNRFAKVKTGIIHDQRKFFPNKIRRIQRRLNNQINIKYNYGLTMKEKVKTALYITLILPVLYDTLRGFIKKPTLAWFFHPIAVYGEVFIHLYYNLKYKIFKRV